MTTKKAREHDDGKEFVKLLLQVPPEGREALAMTLFGIGFNATKKVTYSAAEDQLKEKSDERT